MKRTLVSLSLSLAFFTSLPSFAQQSPTPCQRYQTADKRLNDVYAELQTLYKNKKDFLAKLKKAQKAWLAYRDAHLEAAYPAKDKQAEYGSAYSDCACSENAALVEERVKQLEEWKTGKAEGDVCVGSRNPAKA